MIKIISIFALVISMIGMSFELFGNPMLNGVRDIVTDVAQQSKQTSIKDESKDRYSSINGYPEIPVSSIKKDKKETKIKRVSLPYNEMETP